MSDHLDLFEGQRQSYTLASIPQLWCRTDRSGVLKTSELDDVPDYIDMEKLEMLANEDAWLEYQDIDFGAWANKNLRAMSEEVGVKDVYDTYYDWPSGFIHGNWGSIRDAPFTTCLNPLHRFHRVPRPLQPMPSVLVDCCKLCNRMLDELNGLYPGLSKTDSVAQDVTVPVVCLPSVGTRHTSQFGLCPVVGFQVRPLAS